MARELSKLAPSDHEVGDVIASRYRLVRKLGEGGMGVVWVAHSNALGVEVALKLLRAQLAGTDAVDRMAREARTAALLGHPALVRVFDFGTTEQGAPFLAMELLEGEDLQTLLAREGRLTAERAAALLLPVVDGLGTAHEKGIVHRDVKPENIFLASDGKGRLQPKVLDFGIAKLEHDEAPSRLTQMGAVIGSPQYLSPEQAEGLDDVDARSDVWSVGVLLYELVTGRAPFAANNYNALIRSILRDAPTPITELGAGDAQLWTILSRCLQKDKDERWASMWELGEALALWLFERGVRVDAASRSLRHAWLESGVTGVRIIVGSDAPPPATAPTAQQARTEIRTKKRSPLPGLLALAALTAIVAGLLLAHRVVSPARPAEEGPRAAVAAQVPPSPPSTASPPRPEALQPLPSTTPLPASTPTQTEASSPRSATEGKPALSPVKPVPRAAAASPPRRPTAAKRPSDTEFGF